MTPIPATQTIATVKSMRYSPHIMLRLLAWFRPRPIQIRVITRDVCRLTLAEWRADPALVGMASKFLHDPNFLMMLDVLRTEHIRQKSMRGDPDLTLRAVVQAQGEGYTAAINTLEAMAVEKQPEQEIPTTYADPE